MQCSISLKQDSGVYVGIVLGLLDIVTLAGIACKRIFKMRSLFSAIGKI
ncbi:hypothetical protein [Nostoc sp.]